MTNIISLVHFTKNVYEQFGHFFNIVKILTVIKTQRFVKDLIFFSKNIFKKVNKLNFSLNNLSSIHFWALNFFECYS